MPRPKPTPRTAVAGLLVGLLALGAVAGCSGSSSSEAGPSGPPRPKVIATTPIVADLVTMVAGDEVEVSTLIPPGADPHDFEPSAADAARLRQGAALIVTNGLGLEEMLTPIIEAAESDGTPVLSLGERLDPLPMAAHGDAHGHGDGDGDGHDHGHDHGDEPATAGTPTTEADAALDPHVWLDPDRWARAAAVLAEELATVLPDAGADAHTRWRENAATFARQVNDAAAEVTALLAPVPPTRRILVTNHDALGYFADRFGFTVEGVIIPGGSTQAEPSAADLAELVEVLRATRVPAIFTESTTSSRLPTAVARDAGGDVRVIVVNTDTLGGKGATDATYTGLLVELARQIAGGLGSP